ncbi:Integrase core domain-containing protein [Novosphingobium panipatense]|uniref:Integrase core domain-containing protein n=1 Tax=Novosphingobium panipatense TaxID=428991 RepID=A0ABY1QYM8_9SPHN|nr:Integrase core domain-containing protein [Novosphingobium panipatense]
MKYTLTHQVPVSQACWNTQQQDSRYDRGSPPGGGQVKSFNGWLRDECLNTHWFLSLNDARSKIEAWRKDFN